MNASMTIPSDVQQLPKVRQFAFDFARKLGASEKVAHRTEFIATELCSNAIEYGGGIGKITIELDNDNSSIRIICFNQTKESSVSMRLKEKFHADFDPVQKRGRGLFIIRNWVKEANFEDTDGGVRISVVQSLSEYA